MPGNRMSAQLVRSIFKANAANASCEIKPRISYNSSTTPSNAALLMHHFTKISNKFYRALLFGYFRAPEVRAPSKPEKSENEAFG